MRGKLRLTKSTKSRLNFREDNPSLRSYFSCSLFITISSSFYIKIILFSMSLLVLEYFCHQSIANYLQFTSKKDGQPININAINFTPVSKQILVTVLLISWDFIYFYNSFLFTWAMLWYYHFPYFTEMEAQSLYNRQWTFLLRH